MSSARAALATARAAAEVARRDPSESNLRAVRKALGVVLRFDDASVHGYNPYRDKGGRFAPGEHKQKPKSEAVTKAAAHVEHTAGKRAAAEAKLTDARKAKASALSDARTKLAAARTAAALARKEPSAINVKAAKQAAAHATAAATLVKQHAATVKEHAAAHAGARAEHIEAKKQLATARMGGRPDGAPKTTAEHQASEAAARSHPGQPDRAVTGQHGQQPGAAHGDAFSGRDAIRGRIAEGIRGTSQNAHIDPATQAELRDSNNRIMAAYGVTPRLTTTPDARTVHTVTAEEMGGAYGQMWSEHTPRPGLMTISHEQAALLREHMQLDRASLHELARRSAAGHDDAYFMLFAAHTMHHETMHGHGPSIEMGLHRSTVEELTTEMSARRITADMHGVPSHGEAVNLAYDHIIDPVVAHTAAAAGVSRERAYEAMEHASLSLKRSSGTLTDDEAISHVATKAAEHLGQPDIAGKIANGIYQTSNKLRMGQ